MICKLCGQGINYKDLNFHKECCKAENLQKLESYPSSEQLTCPSCKQYLRLWPKNDGLKAFTCQINKCNSADFDLENDGTNCYLCFKCDYTVCSRCEEETEQENIAYRTRLVRFQSESSDSDSESNYENQLPIMQVSGEVYRILSREQRIMSILEQSIRLETVSEVRRSSSDHSLISGPPCETPPPSCMTW